MIYVDTFLAVILAILVGIIAAASTMKHETLADRIINNWYGAKAFYSPYLMGAMLCCDAVKVRKVFEQSDWFEPNRTGWVLTESGRVQWRKVHDSSAIKEPTNDC